MRTLLSGNEADPTLDTIWRVMVRVTPISCGWYH